MTTIEATIKVDVPLTQAYNQWTQLEDFSTFMHNVEDVNQLDETHNEWVVSVAGVERRYRTEVIQQQPDERIVWKSLDEPVHMGIAEFDELSPELTQVRVALDWEPGGVVESLGAMFGRDRAAVQSALEEFKEFIEGRHDATGMWRGTVNPNGEGAMSTMEQQPTSPGPDSTEVHEEETPETPVNPGPSHEPKHRQFDPETEEVLRAQQERRIDEWRGNQRV
ncbi:SRPBCC family protein [Jonesia quinghaiensis]|uniref:SRPBCC family protein n=1 Tax=Jonesia quinghaiensis TaxID=262806 RepID=UPI00146A6BA8|nr:SRPBCC family protein [Jonesia quinghaiensis]